MIHLFIVRYSVFEEATTEYEVSVIDDLMNDVVNYQTYAQIMVGIQSIFWWNKDKWGTINNFCTPNLQQLRIHNNKYKSNQSR